MELQRAKLFAVACAALVTCGAYAQQNASDQTSSPTTSPTTTPTSPTSPTQTSPTATTPTMATAPATTPPPTGTQTPVPGLTPPPGTANSTAMGSSNNQVFASLDRSHKGYLSQADVASNKFLSANFQRCDTNSDGRLSQIEVSSCMQGASTSEQ